VFLFVGCQSIRNVRSFFESNSSLAGQFTTNEIDELVKSAKRYQGVPYAGGGSNENGMDCSGLLFRVYVDNNYNIPRSSVQQALFGLSIPMNKIQKGDWLFFRTNGSSSINHIGLVIQVNGDQDVQFMHSSTSKGVRSDQLYANYWFKAFDKAIRPFKNNSN
jgi:cell wall-associated NlpC family hydrolase